jgi:hypothetical protein
MRRSTTYLGGNPGILDIFSTEWGIPHILLHQVTIDENNKVRPKVPSTPYIQSREILTKQAWQQIN